MDEKKVMGRPKKDKGAPTEAETLGIYRKHMRACTLRAEGYTQIDAYCISHKITDEDKAANKGSIEDRAYNLFHKPKVRTYLRSLLASKTLEEIVSRAEWLISLQDDIERARQAKNHNAVMNGLRMVGQAVAALREGLVAVKDDGERVKEIIEAFAGEGPEKRKAIEFIIGKVAPDGGIFETPHLVSDNTKGDKKKASSK